MSCTEKPIVEASELRSQVQYVSKHRVRKAVTGGADNGAVDSVQPLSDPEAERQ